MLPYLGQDQISVKVAEHSAYLITELNAFKNVDVKVRVCQSTQQVPGARCQVCTQQKNCHFSCLAKNRKSDDFSC